MSIAYLSIGTNLGDRDKNLLDAIKYLKENKTIENIRISKVYETKAWGLTNQADFLNICVELKTNLSPKELLGICQDIESKLKRKRLIRWGPRTIDLDILLFDDEITDEDDLKIPHERMHQRVFVLKPLMDLNENLKFSKGYVKDLISNLDMSVIKEYEFNELKEYR
ncbi:MAG: 2-amino-4-hydroxy-6-hydroxymethyldihydropteridine diphosphokinase [Peptostreptococcaceae bacterium]|jgi:2-amino-4-hydroxy-6-hydroxymethyldihydropteridine diphosphokinase|nr:2-amino-4-hydroxy-6-hydroxymethyldihydropteridine diphosphokinase [Peptostreptococcaceae bacterium]